MVIVAALAALLIIMTVTPIGYIPIGPLAITVNMIPVAIGAVILGPAGGAALGLVFGLTAFANAAGVLGPSSLVGTALFSVIRSLRLLYVSYRESLRESLRDLSVRH